MTQSFLSIFLLFITPCFGFSNLITDIADQYTRPITILYISENPYFLPVQESDTIVYWTQNKKFLKELQAHNPKNCVIISAKTTPALIQEHALFSHYDIGIIDVSLSSDHASSSYHIADHMYLQYPKKATGLKQITDNYYYLHKMKDMINQRTKGKSVNVRSNFESKQLLKRNESYCWLQGVSLREFYLFNGTYPSDQTIWEQIIENFYPEVSDDFKIKNMILTGETLKIIDYNPKEIQFNLLDQDIVSFNKKRLFFYKLFTKHRLGKIR